MLKKVSSIFSSRQEEAIFRAYAPDGVARHLESLGEDYRKTYKKDVIRLNKVSSTYLADVYKRVSSANELLLNKELEPTFTIIKSPIPFYFSLPGAQFFFSSGLILKYLKSENMLVSVIVFETIRTHRNLYKNKVVVPIGFVRTEELLKMTRINLETKNEINKWVFYCMKRAQFDGFAYLSWLQLQNKYTLEFSLQNSGGRFISQEEYLFKDFLVKEGLEQNTKNLVNENSSKSFYRFMRYLKKKTNET